MQSTAAEHATLLTAGRIHAAEVLPDEGQAKAEARTAASTARSAETFIEALDGYVRDMPLEDGVDRGAVLSRARGYLK